MSDKKIKKKDEKKQQKESEDDYKNKWMRAMADYQNLKKDTEKVQAEFIKYANVGLVQKILPILNNFQVATAHIPENQKDANWVTGIFHIKTQLENLLKNIGVEQIKTVGEKFNPEFHEAVSQREEEGQDADIVVEEIQAGYTMHGKVLEPAKVIVSK